MRRSRHIRERSGFHRCRSLIFHGTSGGGRKAASCVQVTRVCSRSRERYLRLTATTTRPPCAIGGIARAVRTGGSHS